MQVGVDERLHPLGILDSVHHVRLAVGKAHSDVGAGASDLGDV